jgi:polar amino acid transport system substrate-binding protein
MTIIRIFGTAVVATAIAASVSTQSNAQPRTIHAIHSVSAPPFAQKVGDSPSEGLMIDLCNAIAEDNGWTIEYQAMPFGDLIPTLAAGNADMTCTSISYTPQRAEQVAFTPQVFEAGEGMAVLATDTIPYQNWLELRDQPVGTVRGTTYQAAMEQAGFTNLRIYDTGPLALNALAAGEIKAYFILQPTLTFLVGRDYPTLRVVETYQPTVFGSFNIAVRKDDPELLAAINATLAKLQADGTIRRLMAEWGL